MISDKAITMRAKNYPKNPWGALQVLAAVAECGNARIPKEELLKANTENVVLFELLSLTYSSTNFFIRLSEDQVSDYADQKKKFPPKDGTGKSNYQRFRTLTERLSERKVTGNAAKEEVDEFLGDKSVTYLETLFYARVLNHDLRIGIQSGTIQKVFPDMYKVSRVSGEPTYYGCMLSNKQEGDRKQVLPCYADYKMDGIRITVVSDKRAARGFTRNGNSYEAVAELEESIHKSGFRGVLDVEIMAKNWNETSSLLRTKSNETEEWQERRRKELFLHVFDYIPLEDYYGDQETDMPLRKRRKIASKWVKKIKNPQIVMVKKKVLRNESDIVKFYRKALQAGYEGLMLKDPNGGYHVSRNASDRPSFWMKLKPEKDETVKIIGALEGTGRNRGRLGAFLCKSLNGKRKYRVGGGFKDVQRDEFWKKRKSLIGKKIDVLVQDEDGSNSDIIARFPRFKRFREDI